MAVIRLHSQHSHCCASDSALSIQIYHSPSSLANRFGVWSAHWDFTRDVRQLDGRDAPLPRPDVQASMYDAALPLLSGQAADAGLPVTWSIELNGIDRYAVVWRDGKLFAATRLQAPDGLFPYVRLAKHPVHGGWSSEIFSISLPQFLDILVTAH